MSFLKRLQSRWKLQSITQVVVVLIVFACTGTTVMYLKKPIIGLIADPEDHSILITIFYYVFIYNIILLGYGFLFGQFSFFWQFEKKMWYRLTGRKKDENPQ
jgi:hypothetical protein